MASVRVAVKGDTEIENGERFSLAVTPSGGIAGGADTIGRATIQNDDAPIRDVRLHDCRFSDVAKDSVVEHVEDLVLEDVIINGVRIG